VLRYRVTKPDGKRIEHGVAVGLVHDFPKENDAWREVDKLGLLAQINAAPMDGRIHFDALAEHYLRSDFGADCIRPKSQNTKSITEHIIRDYLSKRWGSEIADEIKPLELQRWLKSLHDSNELAWTTISKMRGVMHRIYKVGMLHELVTKNPVANVETRSKTNYRAIVLKPAQTFAILTHLDSILHYALVLTCAATALRASEVLALRWSDLQWDAGRIRVSKRWANGENGRTKTDASDGYVPLHPLLAEHLREWHQHSPYAKDTDFIFPSLKCSGKGPFPLRCSLPTICVRQRKKLGSSSKMGSALASITLGIR
jgi:integrase